MNKINIINHLLEISKEYIQSGDTIRAGSFSRAAESIKLADYIDNIETSNQIKGLRNVGPSTLAVIDDFIKTGTSSRLENLKKSNDNSNIKEDLNKVKNILNKFRVGK